jgi:hypothetical protein
MSAFVQAGGVDVLQQLLRKVHELLDADNLLVLAQENDHTYLCLSRFFQKLLDVAKLFLQPSEAEALVHDTHCRFLEKMLSRRSFNTMRALVREVNSRLCRARRRDQNEDSPSADAKLVPVLEFLETRNVVEELLTVNMHQWQYVESLQQLLTTLAEVHALSKKTLRSLWGQLRQVSHPLAVRFMGLKGCLIIQFLHHGSAHHSVAAEIFTTMLIPVFTFLAASVAAGDMHLRYRAQAKLWQCMG